MNYVGKGDREDYYQFEVKGYDYVALAVSSPYGDVLLNLYDSTGNPIETPQSYYGGTIDLVWITKPRGRYYVRIHGVSDDCVYGLTVEPFSESDSEPRSLPLSYPFTGSREKIFLKR
jgi:hypothetical protein